MVVVIQGLVILFSGALANLPRPMFDRLFLVMVRPAAPALAGSRGRDVEDFFTLLMLMLSATLRVATPLILCAMGGLFSERSGIIDIGLEGKMLAAAFAAASTAAVTGSPWLALIVAIADRGMPGAAARLCLHHPSRQPGGERRRHQHPRCRPDHRARHGVVPTQGGQTPGLPPEARFMPIALARRRRHPRCSVDRPALCGPDQRPQPALYPRC